MSGGANGTLLFTVRNLAGSMAMPRYPSSDSLGMFAAHSMKYSTNRRRRRGVGLCPGSLMRVPCSGGAGKLAVALATRVA
eukprot:scaffold3891_cov290-Chaetoceros_neogracile.AAC.5